MDIARSMHLTACTAMLVGALLRAGILAITPQATASAIIWWLRVAKRTVSLLLQPCREIVDCNRCHCCHVPLLSRHCCQP